jgi:hypothetical protein
LDVYARNPSTQVVNYGQTTVDGKSGLNIYQIYPKKIHYTLSGRTDSSVANVIMGGTGSSKYIYDFTFGKASPQSFSAIMSSGTVPKNIRFEYVDGSGNLRLDGSANITALNTVVTLGTNIISINKQWINGSVGTADQLLIRVGTANTTVNTIASSDIDDVYNGVITVPNGYIGYLTNMSVFSPTGCWFNIMKWDENSIRSNTYGFLNSANQHFASGYNGSLGGIYTAGESIAIQRVTAAGACLAIGMFVLEPI